MKQCYCENSVEIYGYFETEEYFIIVMELCDNTLFKELEKTKKWIWYKRNKRNIITIK